jgi:hypothetical protein
MDFKKTALTLKTRAKELGYDLKLTHAQELLAVVSGHKTRHSALLADKTGLIDPPLKVKPETINHNCQICQSRPRTKVHLLYHDGPDLWYLCDECTKPSSAFSLENGAKDLTDRYPLDVICLRDMNFNGAYKASLNQSFQFQLICSDGSIGDTYQFVPGLQTGYSKLSLLNVTKNKLETSGWWYWPIIPL